MTPDRSTGFRRVWRNENGSAMTEYAVITALMAGLAVVLVEMLNGEIGTFGSAIREALASLQQT